MVNVDEIYGQVLQSVVSSINGFEKNFEVEEENAYVDVTYQITTPSGIEQQFNWLLTKGQTTVRDPKDLATGEVLNQSLEDLTGVSEESFVVSINPQPEVPKPSIISIDFDQLNPLTIPIYFDNSIGGEGSRGNLQLGSSNSSGGVLGGRNFSNPEDAIENEFRFRTRITDRER